MTSHDAIKGDPITFEATDEQKKDFAAQLLNKNIAAFRKKWLSDPPQIQMESLRNTQEREALIDLKIVEADDPRVLQILEEEEDAREYIKNMRNKNGR